MLSPDEWVIVELSLRVSFVATLITLPIAFGFAWILTRTRFHGRFLVDALVHLPLVLPPVVTGWGLLILFGNQGPIGAWCAHWLGMSFVFRWTGAALAAAVMALPLMVRAIRLSLEAVDQRLEGAARTLGAKPFNCFCTITLPLCLPGIFAALTLGFARSLGEFGATITFASSIPGETKTLPLAIYAALQVPGGEAMATRLALLSVTLSLCGLMLADWLTRRHVSSQYHVI